MPTLFDSHDEFNEWFSKDIESHAEKGGTIDQSEYPLKYWFDHKPQSDDVVSQIRRKKVKLKLLMLQLIYYVFIEGEDFLPIVF